MKELESLLLRIENSRRNKQTGKIVKSENLRPILNKLVKEGDDGQRARLMGRRITRRRIKRKAIKKRGQ